MTDLNFLKKHSISLGDCGSKNIITETLTVKNTNRKLNQISIKRLPLFFIKNILALYLAYVDQLSLVHFTNLPSWTPDKPLLGHGLFFISQVVVKF